jgi:hypothetical protein
MNRREALTTGSYGIITGVDNTVTAVISRHHILIIFRMARLAARTHSQCARRSRRESKLKFTSQVRQNRLKSMGARDQRDRQQSSAGFPCLDGRCLLRALIENIEIGARREMPRAAAQDNRAATGVSRQVRVTSIHTKPTSHVGITASDFFTFPWAIGSKWRGVRVDRAKHLYHAARSM